MRNPTPNGTLAQSIQVKSEDTPAGGLRVDAGLTYTLLSTMMREFKRKGIW